MTKSRKSHKPSGVPPAVARSFDDSWRLWIAENLLLGISPQALAPILVEHGFDAQAAAREIEKAQASPYLRAGEQLAERLKSRVAKREWVLEIHRRLDRLRPEAGRIERRHQLSREDFLRDHYSVHRPVIITGMMDDWPALQKWSPAYFKENFGEAEVEIQAKRTTNARYEIDQPRHAERIRFGDFIDQVVSCGESNDVYMTANNTGGNAIVLADLWKDVVQFPEYLDARSSQLGFFWFGPAGTITPLHHDLTNNFMAQVYGRKLVKLVAAEDLAYLYNHLHCYTEVDFNNIDYDKFPLMRDVRVLECELAPGEILFLPVGCWHYVRSLEVSVTMSFTNFVFDNDFSSMYRTYQAV